MAFTSLPTFDKQWAMAHAIALAMFSSAAATGVILLWRTPCEDSTRKPLMGLSVNCFNYSPSITNLLLIVVQAWLQRITGAASVQRLPHFMYIMLQLYFLTAGLGLGLSVYEAPNTSYDLVLVKLQTAATTAAFFVCAGYDFALMLKTNFNTPSPNDADKLEKDVGKESEQSTVGQA